MENIRRYEDTIEITGEKNPVVYVGKDRLSLTYCLFTCTFYFVLCVVSSNHAKLNLYIFNAVVTILFCTTNKNPYYDQLYNTKYKHYRW